MLAKAPWPLVLLELGPSTMGPYTLKAPWPRA